MTARYLLIFFLPIAVALAFNYLTWSIQLQLLRGGIDWIMQAASADPSVTLNTTLSGADKEHLKLSMQLNWIFRICIAVSVILLSLLAPARTAASYVVNFLTVMVFGFFLARSLIGFGSMGWLEFAICLLIGVSGSLLLLLIRRSNLATEF